MIQIKKPTVEANSCGDLGQVHGFVLLVEFSLRLLQVGLKRLKYLKILLILWMVITVSGLGYLNNQHNKPEFGYGKPSRTQKVPNLCLKLVYFMLRVLIHILNRLKGKGSPR